jgi:hypothetical protein
MAYEVSRAPFALVNPYAEPIIGSIHRECLAYLIIFNEARLRLIFRSQPLPIVSSSGAENPPVPIFDESNARAIRNCEQRQRRALKEWACDRKWRC